ncbi:MAG: hypothetical protein K0R17_87 [Rariglobus sp.]|jgi:hypothetical protein|nr:hypothetical protein [Rariglobus sp.]
MTQYILLIHSNTTTEASTDEWNQFFTEAQASGLFKGGSAIGDRIIVGNTQSAKPSDHIVGYMRFDADDKQKLLALLNRHPVVVHGGAVELCELPKS